MMNIDRAGGSPAGTNGSIRNRFMEAGGCRHPWNSTGVNLLLLNAFTWAAELNLDDHEPLLSFPVNPSDREAWCEGRLKRTGP